MLLPARLLLARPLPAMLLPVMLLPAMLSPSRHSLANAPPQEEAEAVVVVVVGTHHQTEEDTEEALGLHQGTTLAEESGEALSQTGMQPPVCTAPVALALKPGSRWIWNRG